MSRAKTPISAKPTNEVASVRRGPMRSVTTPARAPPTTSVTLTSTTRAETARASAPSW